MSNRRNFIKAALAVGATSTIPACMTTESKTAVKSTTDQQFPKGIIYTKENPGKWAKKVGGHLPEVKIDGDEVTVTTHHGMSTKHYIVRHTIVNSNGDVLADNTFSPSDDEPISVFKISEKNTKLFATSFCNKHDFWLTSFDV